MPPVRVMEGKVYMSDGRVLSANEVRALGGLKDASFPIMVNERGGVKMSNGVVLPGTAFASAERYVSPLKVYKTSLGSGVRLNENYQVPERRPINPRMENFSTGVGVGTPLSPYRRVNESYAPDVSAGPRHYGFDSPSHVPFFAGTNKYHSVAGAYI